MNSIHSKKIAKTIKKLIEFLVEKKYEEIAKWSNYTRLSGGEIAEAIKDYGHPIKLPPEKFLDNIDIIKIETAKPQQWSVVFPFWTEDEGESDLSVEATIIESIGDVYEIEIDNIHVL